MQKFQPSLVSVLCGISQIAACASVLVASFSVGQTWTKSAKLFDFTLYLRMCNPDQNNHGILRDASHALLVVRCE